jgi:lipopolysaccharide/colanic/teichoic acid biosynthesis glycosyltransferase
MFRSSQETSMEGAPAVGGGSRPDLPPPLHLVPDTIRVGGRYDRYVKPVVDRLGAALLLLVLLPVLAVVSTCVLVGLGRPIFFRQPRVGRNGQTFGMLKFRTMRPDRRRQLAPLPATQDRRKRHKAADDPRHTAVGRFLRRCSLDELPQLWNVLIGEMSLVGPRPELTAVVERYESWQHLRHAVKPGITGLWQVTERRTSDGDMHLHTARDIAYLEQISLRTDLSILLRTPLALTKGR